MIYEPSEDAYGSRRPLLGPCRCVGCGEPLWWAKRNTRVLGTTTLKVAWRESDGVIHRCPELPGFAHLRARRYRGRTVE